MRKYSQFRSWLYLTDAVQHNWSVKYASVAMQFVVQVEQGLRLYNQHKQQAAVRKWRSALKRIRKRDDKFALLGYLYQAYMDWGKYR